MLKLKVQHKNNLAKNKFTFVIAGAKSTLYCNQIQESDQRSLFKVITAIMIRHNQFNLVAQPCELTLILQ